MFSNFVTFTEVVKLSQKTFFEMRRVNYSDSIIRFILPDDIDTAEQVADLIEDPSLSENFAYLFSLCDLEYEVRYIQLMRRFFIDNKFETPKIKLTILQYCCIHGRLDIIEGISCKFIDGEFLYIATVYGHLNIIKYLIEMDNADPFRIGDILLQTAIRFDYLEVVEYFVNIGMNLLANEKQLMTLAINKGSILTNYLIEKGLNQYRFDGKPIWKIENGQLVEIEY